jgi:hypothetical protein
MGLWRLIQYDTSPTSPLLTQFADRYIAQLEDEEASELIEQTNNPYGKVSVSPELREHIKSYTGNHPLLIQRLCYRLCQEDCRALRSIGSDDLVIDQHLAYCFENDYQNLSLDQRRILMEVAGCQVATEEQLCELTSLPPPTLSTHIRTLKNLGLIRGHTVLYVSNYFLWQWLLGNRPSLRQTLEQNVRQELERTGTMLDPGLKAWAIGVLTNASAFLFSEVKEIMKMRREKQTRKGKKSKDEVSHELVAGAQVAAEMPDREQRQAWVEQIVQQVNIAQRQEDIREIETLIRQIEANQEVRRNTEELLAKGGLEAVGVSNLMDKLDNVEKQITEKKRKLRALWQRVCEVGTEPSE